MQILYVCGCCSTVPLKACSWFLLTNPKVLEFWACPLCGEKFQHSTCPQVILCKLPGESAICFRVRGMPSGLENEVKILQIAQVAKRLNLQAEGLTLEAILKALKDLADSASERMTAYMPIQHVVAQRRFEERFPQAVLVCKHEDLSLPSAGRRFAAVKPTGEVPELCSAGVGQLVYLAASTMDLDDVQVTGKQQKRHLAHLQMEVAAAKVALRNSNL